MFAKKKKWFKAPKNKKEPENRKADEAREALREDLRKDFGYGSF